VHQNRARIFRRIKRPSNFVEGARLFLVQDEIRSCDELLIGMWIADDRFFAQFREAAFDQSAQCLVIERCLAQKLGGAGGCVQARDCFQEFGLPRRALSGARFRSFSNSALSILRPGWTNSCFFQPTSARRITWGSKLRITVSIGQQ